MAHLSKDQQGNIILRDDWYIEDVRSMLDEGEELTDMECIQILESMADNFDANIGINWDVIRYEIDLTFKEKKENE